MGHDIGRRTSALTQRRVVGYETPNINRIAKEGTIFTDYYAENSCTAGRSSFITGQHGIRTGLTKVGIPGRAHGHEPARSLHRRSAQEPRLATGQFGKNHVGDRNETAHRQRFNELFGNLYHLNAEEEPELPDYPKDRPSCQVRAAPRPQLQGLRQG